MTLPQIRRIRWGVRLVLALGVVASTVANILHAEPNPISQTIAAWPPVALLVTIELISRVPVHRRSLALVRLVATATIAGIAAWVSYWHMAGVISRYGETGASPYLIPLTVDGLVVVASVSLVELAGRIRDTETTPAVTPEPVAGPVAEPVTAWPVVTPAEPVSRHRPKTLTSAAKVERAAAKLPGATVAQIAAKAGVSESTARRYLPSPIDPAPAETAVNGRVPDLAGVSS